MKRGGEREKICTFMLLLEQNVFLTMIFPQQNFIRSHGTESKTIIIHCI